MKLLLDTCTFLWLAIDSVKVSKAALAAFLQPGNERFLSAASAWEITIKYSLGRLELAKKPEYFIAEIREKAGIDTLAVDEECALQTARLPRLHSDPFDRMLVAQAIVHGMVIVTPDEAIERYAVRVLW
ncbi:MAG: type II toxin-antitoxin system VapC family toxin [Bryobacteraceae bacterium]